MQRATRMLHLSGAAYCGGDQIEGWNCGTHCTNVNGLAEQVYIDHAAEALAAFVAWDSVENAVVVAFRGTIETSITDWVHNLAYTKSHPLSKYPDAGVHHGWWNSWLTLEADTVEAIKNIASAHNTKSVLVTGHSMGASLAADAAMSLKLNQGYDTAVVNFESPRPGDQKFMEAMAKEVPDFWRITHADDIVPHAPPEAFGFYHGATEVFFPSATYTDLTHAVCDGSGEDSSCSNKCASSLSCTSVDNHLNVMGVTMGGDQCASAGASVFV
jgi:hypothetical protein